MTFKQFSLSFYWSETIDVYICFSFVCSHRYLSLHFQTLSAFRGKRKKEYGRKHSQQKPLTSITCVRRRVSNWSLCLLCSILFIFSERKCISKSWRKLMNYKPENRIPWLFTDFDNIKGFPHFLKNSLTFPRPWKIFVFPWLFPDRGNHDKQKTTVSEKLMWSGANI